MDDERQAMLMSLTLMLFGKEIQRDSPASRILGLKHQEQFRQDQYGITGSMEDQSLPYKNAMFDIVEELVSTDCRTTAMTLICSSETNIPEVSA